MPCCVVPLAVSGDEVAALGVIEQDAVAWSEDEFMEVRERAAERYAGEYVVTPTAEAQTLATDGLVMDGNVTVNPIPSNYGLITWNGSTLMVS